MLKRPLGHVFYCIGLTADFRSHPFDTVRAHVTVLSDLLEHADFASLLYLSSTRVYGRSTSTCETSVLSVSPEDPSDLYNLSKLLGESLCFASSRASVRVARLSNVIGAGMGSQSLVGELFHEALAGAIRLKTHPDSAKDYILIDDVVRLLWRIADDGHDRIYNVASGVQTTHREWLSALQSTTGCLVQTDDRAPYQTFGVIDIRRIRTEFRFEATRSLDAVPYLVQVVRRELGSKG